MEKLRQINSMSTFIQRILSPPQFLDDEKNRIAHTLNFVLLSISGLMVFTTPFILLFAVQKLTGIVLVVIALSICYIALRISHQGRPHLAVTVFIIYMWLNSALFTYLAGGSTAIAIALFVPVISMSALFLGMRASVFSSTLTVSYAFLLSTINNSSHPIPQHLPLDGAMEWITFGFSIALVLIPLLHMQHELRKTVKTARNQLKERNQAEHALRDSEERFRLISSVTSDYTFSSRLDENGNLKHILLTGAFEQITGYTPEEFQRIGGWQATLHPDDVEKDAVDMAALNQNQAVETQVRIIRKDGEVRWMLVNARPVWDEENNRLVGINGGVRDVTEREKAEQAILKLNAELTRNANHLAAINEIASDISAITDLSSTLKRILSKLKTILPLDAFYVALYDPKRNFIEFPIMYDVEKFWEQEDVEIDSRSGVGKVLNSGTPILINRTAEEIAKLEAAKNPVLGDEDKISASILLTPLSINNNIIGVISIHSYTLNSYDESHIDILMGASYQIATAVENARLYDSLKESEERYRLISSATSDYSFSTKINDKGEWEHTLISGAFEHITGYTPQEYKEMGGWWAVLHPDDKEQDERDMAQLQQNQPVETQVRIIRKDGDVRTLDVSARPVWDIERNQLVGIDGGVRDVTEREIAQQSILDLNARLTAKAEHLTLVEELASDISAVTDLVSTLKRIQGKLSTIMSVDAFFVGLYENDMLSFPVMYDSGKYWEEPLSPVSSKSASAKVLKTGQPILINYTKEQIPDEIDTNYMLGDNSRVSTSMLFAPLRINEAIIGVISCQSYTHNAYSDNHVELIMGASYHIAIAIQNARLYDSLQAELAERKRLETELQTYTTKLESLVDDRTNALSRAKEQLELILNTTTDALAFANPNGDVLLANPAFKEMFNKKVDRSIEGILHLLDDEEQITSIGNALLEVIYDNKKQRLEAKISTAPEQETDVDLTLLPITSSEDDSRRGILLSGHDVTQYKEIERFKARFVADAVHDLATPISGLNSRIYLLKRNPERLEDHVSALENQVSHLRHLLEDLRLLSRMDREQIELRMEMCSVNNLVQQVYDTYQPVAIDKQQSLVLNADPALPEIQIDRQQMSRVLVNLVSNAINYTPEHRDIHIETTMEDKTAIIRVSDQGMGISAEDLPHIFDRFYRADEARESVASGTGLGLAITNEIINLHGGKITVASEINKGSTFTVMLPLNAN